jgi:hypothetical protein
MRPLSSTPLDIRGMGEAAYSLPLWQQYEMRDLIAPANGDRDSLAYWSDTGRTYAVDELRRRRTQAGHLALVEEAGTRLNDSDLTLWGRPEADTDVSPVPGPNGLQGYRITHPSGDADTRIAQLMGSAATHTISFWARMDTPGDLQIRVGASTVLTVNATTEWQHFSHTLTIGEESFWNIYAGPLAGYTPTELAGVQVEQHPYPTSWIPGPGTARAACDVETSVITQNKGLLLFPFRRPYALTGSEQFRLYEASGGPSDLLINVNPTGTISTQIEGVGMGSTPAVDVTDWNIYGYAWNNGAARVFLNGTKEITASVADPIGSTVAFLYHGPFSANRYLNGVGGALQREGHSFTDDQIAAIMADELARLPA